MPIQTNDYQVRIEPWSEGDLALLRDLNAPEMLEHLGGPESEEQLLARHKRYVDSEGKLDGQMYRIVLLPGLQSVGSTGYWHQSWRGEAIYEVGWGVLPPYQGRGIASQAAGIAVSCARAKDPSRPVHAFPSVSNPASGAVCRKLGFKLMGECEIEYPKGRMMRCNDWRLE